MAATQDVDTILDVWTNQGAGRIFPGSIPGSEPIRFPFQPDPVPLSNPKRFPFQPDPVPTKARRRGPSARARASASPRKQEEKKEEMAATSCHMVPRTTFGRCADENEERKRRTRDETRRG